MPRRLGQDFVLARSKFFANSFTLKRRLKRGYVDKTDIVDKPRFGPPTPFQNCLQQKADTYKSTCCVITSNGVFGAPWMLSVAK